MSTDEIIDKKKQEIDQLNKEYRRLKNKVRNLMELESELSKSISVKETISLVTQRIQSALKTDTGADLTNMDAYAHVIEALVAYNNSKNI